MMWRIPELISDAQYDQIIRDLLETEDLESIDEAVEETEGTGTRSWKTPFTSSNAVQSRQSASLQLAQRTEGEKRKLKEYNINSETLGSDKSVKSEVSDTGTVLLSQHTTARSSTHVCKAVTAKPHCHSSDIKEKPEKQPKSSDSTSSKRLCQYDLKEKASEFRLDPDLSKEYARYIDKFDVKPSETQRSEHTLQTTSISSMDGLKSCDPDESGRKDAQSRQPVLLKLHASLLAEDPIFDVTEMKAVISTLVAAQARCCTEIPKPGSREWTLFRQEQEDTRRRRDLFNIAQADKEEIIKSVGSKSVYILETVTKECVEFAKNIPGYRSLQLDDQIALLKASRLETTVPSVIRSINVDINVATPLPGQHFTFEECLIVFSDHFKDTLEFLKEHSSKSIWHTITNEEEAVIKATILTDADRCPHLHDRKNVVRMHLGMISCLMYVLEGVTENVPKRLAELEYMLHTCSLFTAKYFSLFKEKLIKMPGHADNLALNEIL